MGLYWLTFIDDELPDGDEQFMGVILAEGETPQDALQTTFMMGINPGYGQVSIFDVMPNDREATLPKLKFIELEELNSYGFFTHQQKRMFH